MSFTCCCYSCPIPWTVISGFLLTVMKNEEKIKGRLDTYFKLLMFDKHPFIDDFPRIWYIFFSILFPFREAKIYKIEFLLNKRHMKNRKLHYDYVMIKSNQCFKTLYTCLFPIFSNTFTAENIIQSNLYWKCNSKDCLYTKYWSKCFNFPYTCFCFMFTFHFVLLTSKSFCLYLVHVC